MKMRMSRSILPAIVLSLLTACGTASDTHRQLMDVRTVMNTAPAEALETLETLHEAACSDTVSRAGRSDAALWSLLYTQTSDKCLVTHVTDSIILTAVRYYAAPRQERELRALAQFYLGSVCRDLGDDYRAVEAYLPALDLFAALNDVAMQRRTAQNIADHLFNQHLYAESATYYRTAYRLAADARDTLRMIMPMAGVAKCDMATHEFEASFDGYRTVLALSQAIDNSTGIALACEQLSILERRRGHAAEALALASEAEVRRSGTDLLFPYYLKGMAFNALGMADSAAYYLRLAKPSDMLPLRASIEAGLAAADSTNGHLEEAYTHLQQYAAMKDDINTSIDRLRMKDILTRHADGVSQQHTHRLRISIALALIACFLVGALVLLLHHRQRRHDEDNGALFKQQLNACMNRFMQTPWNDELSAIHLSTRRGIDAFSEDKAIRLRRDLLEIFRPVVSELRMSGASFTDGELCYLFLYRLGYSTYTQTICTACTDSTIRSYKHRLKGKLAEPYLTLFKLKQ